MTKPFEPAPGDVQGGMRIAVDRERNAVLLDFEDAIDGFVLDARDTRAIAAALLRAADELEADGGAAN